MVRRKSYESISRTVLKMIREMVAEDSIVQKWDDTVYGDIQKITNPKKGVLGERLVAKWLDELGYLAEGHGYERQRGGNNFDLLVLIADALERVEVKLATQDTSDKYQFSWIALDHDVALIVLLGIDPDSIHLAVKTKQELQEYRDNPVRGRKLTPVPPKNPTHVKWTASKAAAEMREIKRLDDVKQVFDRAICRFIADKEGTP